MTNAKKNFIMIGHSSQKGTRVVVETVSVIDIGLS